MTDSDNSRDTDSSLTGAHEDRVERLIASMDDARDGELHDEGVWASYQDPEWMEAYAAFSEVCRSPSFERAIPPKYQELFYIVIIAYRGFQNTLVSHMRRAIRMGATKQEIMEALEAAVLPGGAPVLHLGIAALMELESEKKDSTS